MLFKVIMSGLIIAALCPLAHSAPVQWAGNTHWYEAIHVAEGLNWTDARNAAISNGGYLATITSAPENDFVFNLANANDALWYIDNSNNGIGPWLGGYQPAGSPEPAGGWTWDVTGEPWGYAIWGSGEPNNWGGTEHYLHLFGHQTLKANTWNDIPHDVLIRGYIIETVPEPASATLLLLALPALLRRRRRKHT